MPQDDKALLLRLQEQRVEFVIIGGVCSVLHGASLVTLDLDICCPFDPVTLYRIEAAGVGDYAACLRASVIQETSFGRVRTLSLDAIIAAKLAAGREKDLAAVRQLRAIKERNEHPREGRETAPGDAPS